MTLRRAMLARLDVIVVVIVLPDDQRVKKGRSLDARAMVCSAPAAFNVH
jgi:hypothetical protein